MIAVLGSTAQDLVVLPGRAPVSRPGGTPLYAARALAANGVPAAVATRAADPALWVPLQALAEPLCVQVDEEGVAFELTYAADGSRAMALAALGPTWTAADVTGFAARALRDVDWVQVGSLRRGDIDAGALAAIAAGGRAVALDAQGLLRAARVGPIVQEGPLDAALLAHVHALKLSQGEARAAFGTEDPAEVRAAAGVAEAIVTRGAAGAGVAWEGGAEDVVATAVSGADPTGAGDALLALYAAARASGAPPARALRRAGEGVAALLAGQDATSA